MNDFTWVWIPITILAAGLQTGRNAIQLHLTNQLGTVGATLVRFLYGFPVSVLLTGIVIVLSKSEIPNVNYSFVLYVIVGAYAQILATALMLSAMRYRGFVVVTALTKAEPIEVAVFGLIILNDQLSTLSTVGIICATFGVILLSHNPANNIRKLGLYPVLTALSAGIFFAIASVSFRGAILSIEGGNVLINSSWTLSFCLAIQTLSLCIWMYFFSRSELIQTFKLRRIAFLGGALGALASSCWFLGFALTAAANVRTLGLIEIFFAQILTWRIFIQKITPKEILGIAGITLGVGVLLLSQI